MPIGPTLETERLILRPPQDQDFPAFCAMMQDEEAARYIGGVMTPSVAWRSLCMLTGAWIIEGFSMFSVIEKATGDWVGRLGPWRPHGWPGTEVGYGIVRSAWGKGYALEGTTAAMDYAIDELGWNEIIQTIHPDNAASIRLAERLGARKLRTFDAPPPFAGEVWDVYGQSAAEWRQHRGI